MKLFTETVINSVRAHLGTQIAAALPALVCAYYGVEDLPEQVDDGCLGGLLLKAVLKRSDFECPALAGVNLLLPPGPHALTADDGFVIGGVICFRGVRSVDYNPPGLPPVWWESIPAQTNFTLHFAQAWAVGAMQEMMDGTETENKGRADSLNLSLCFAVGSAILMAVSAVTRLVAIP